jgi:hypothetical protein
MTTQIHQQYAWRWIQEAIGVGIILGVVAYALVDIGGLSAILVVIGVQLLGVALLVFSLFEKIEAMIHDLTEVGENSQNTVQESESESDEWSHRLKSDGNGRKVVKVSGKTRTATFVIDSDGIRVKSRLNRWLLNNDWVREATEYLETVVDTDKE